MRAEELRIGNYIQVPFGDKEPWVRSVDTIYYDSIMTENGRHCFEHEFDFVPLTEEWLVRLGFELHYGRYYKGNFCYYPDLKMFEWRGLPLLDSLWDKVHKLQNLHFALTGQELTIK
jgi:hypothetical protein